MIQTFFSWATDTDEDGLLSSLLIVILDPALFSYYDPTAGDDLDGDGVGDGAKVSLNPDITELLERVPRDRRAKVEKSITG